MFNTKCIIFTSLFFLFQATIANWSDVFYIAAAVYVFTASFYAIFASAELQPWDQGKEESDDDISMKEVSTIDSKS